MVHPYRPSGSAADLAATAATIARDIALPHAAEVDAQARYPIETLKALADGGFHGLCLQKDLGGRGEGMRAFASVVEELAGGCASSAMIYVMHVSAAQAIVSSKTFAARGAVLKEIAAGRHLTTLAFSESGSRSQFWAPVSRMEENDGRFVTSATKSWVTSANHADSYVSSAQKPGAAAPTESTVYFLPARTPGVRVTSSFNGLGLRGNDSAPVAIEKTAIPRGDLMTAHGEGLAMMLNVVLPWFVVGTSAMSNGLCRAAVARTAEHLKGTGFEHTGTPLRDLPGLRARLAEMSVRTEAARALLGHTLDHLEQPGEATPLFVLQSRLAALQAADTVTDLAMKACGGAAFSRQLGVERIFRDARAGWVMAPTVDHLHEFIGRALTGLPLL